MAMLNPTLLPPLGRLCFPVDVETPGFQVFVYRVDHSVLHTSLGASTCDRSHQRGPLNVDSDGHFARSTWEVKYHTRCLSFPSFLAPLTASPNSG